MKVMKDLAEHKGNTAGSKALAVQAHSGADVQPLRFGLVGLGGISQAHLAGASGLKTARIVAGVDPNAQARDRANQAHGLAVYENLEDMLNAAAVRDEPLHGLVICTPPSFRLPLVRAAFAAGLPVLMEKPIAHRLEDAHALIELERQFPDIPARMAFCHRFTPAVNEMKSWIESGRLGTIIRVDNTFTDWHPAMKDSWMSDPTRSGGGSLMDTGCHSVDLVRHLIGPVRVCGVVRHFNWPDRGESGGTMLLASEPVVNPRESMASESKPDASATRTPIAVTIRTGWAEPTCFTVSVTGDAGTLRYDFMKAEEMIFQPVQGAAVVVEVRTHEVRFADQMAAFVDLINRPSDPSPMARFEEGLWVSKMLQCESSSVSV